MSAERTATSQPMALRIADDLRIQIETDQLKPGDSLPTLSQLMETYGCSTTTARNAISMLKHQGLIVGGRGQAPVVRGRPRRHERSSERHQIEKDLVKAPETVRGHHGLAEQEMDDDLDEFDFSAEFTTVPADLDLAQAFDIQPGTGLLKREFRHQDKRSGQLEAWSVSWLPTDLIKGNPKISDPAYAAWPGGTMHQLYTVGIEVDHVIDRVTSAAPTTVEAQQWGLPEGVPLLWVRRISIDTEGRVVEVTDACFPADRTMLTFHTPLTRWESK